MISELEKAREFPWNDVAGNLKSAIETSQDQDSSGRRRMCLTTKIVMRIGATPGCSGCARSRSHTGACRVPSRRTLVDAKECESSRTVGAGVREFENGRSRSWINCKNECGVPPANSGDAARTIIIIIIFQIYRADARTDTKHSERADGFTGGNGSTRTQRTKESATE